MIHLSVDTLFRSLKNNMADFEEVEDLCDRNHDRNSSPIEAGLILDWKQDKLEKVAFHQSSLCHETITPDPEFKYGVYISMTEIYNDKVFDLFDNPGPGKRRMPLNVHTDQNTREVSLTNVAKMFVANSQEAFRILEKGLKLRTSHSTGSNETSSRSHAIITFEVKRTKWSTGEVHSSKLIFADLAGTERNKLTKTQGSRFQESCAINQSLMLLGQCLQMQRGEKQNSDNSLFRSCKLTHILLSNAFRPGSTQKSVVLVAMDPFGDLNSAAQILRYSSSVREIPDLPRPEPSSANTSLIISSNNTNSSFRKSNSSPSKFLSASTQSPSKNRVSSTSSNNSAYSSETLAESDRRLSEMLAFTSDNEDFHNLKSVKPSVQHLLDKIRELEQKLSDSEQRCLDIEEEVRNEMADAMDQEMEKLRSRYLDQRDSDSLRGQELTDKKIKILTDSIRESEIEGLNNKISHMDKKNKLLERENQELLGENEKLREFIKRSNSDSSSASRSPLKRASPIKKRLRPFQAFPLNDEDSSLSEF